MKNLTNEVICEMMKVLLQVHTNTTKIWMYLVGINRNENRNWIKMLIKLEQRHNWTQVGLESMPSVSANKEESVCA